MIRVNSVGTIFGYIKISLKKLLHQSQLNLSGRFDVLMTLHRLCVGWLTMPLPLLAMSLQVTVMAGNGNHNIICPQHVLSAEEVKYECHRPEDVVESDVIAIAQFLQLVAHVPEQQAVLVEVHL